MKLSVTRFLTERMIENKRNMPLKTTWALVAFFGVFAAIAAGKSDYLDLMESAVDAYSKERRAEYVAKVEKEGISEHGFARLTANMGQLVANGRRRKGLYDEFVRMMDICAREQPIAAKRNGEAQKKYFAPGSEFAVKELVLAVAEAEKSGLFPKEKTDFWRAAFGAMKADDIYTVKPKPGDGVARNWTVFGAASEQVRIAYGMGGDASWVERYVSDQLRFFDENGMYRDPGSPMVYDFVTRLQYALILHCGYDGPSRGRLERMFELSAEPTLAMQTVNGEIPFGGRSNQFLHNETCYAALCEWYAARDFKSGKIERARRFRAAAERAVENVRTRLAKKEASHVKNRYPADSLYGCERYAYFDKYMVTMGSWAYLAMMFADESIPPATGRERDGAFVTSPDFHRVMVNSGDWTLEFDLCGQKGYDATGLGRLVKRGAPSALALSVPFPVDAHYRLDVTNAFPMAIGPKGVSRLEVEKATAEEISLTYPGGSWETKVVSNKVEMALMQKGEIVFTLPAFEFDGAVRTRIEHDGKTLSVFYGPWVCRYRADAPIVDTGRIFGNRNGHYRLFEVHAKDAVHISADIEWYDDFDAASLDENVWVDWVPSFQGRRTGFLFARDNVAVSNGCLNLTGRMMRDDEKTVENLRRGFDTYAMAYVRTREKFRYGFFECRARTMNAKVCNAFWLYGPLSDKPKKKFRPGDFSEEIDMFEIFGSLRNWYGTVHCLKTPYLEGIVHGGMENLENKSRKIALDFDPSADFHVYGFRWTEKELKWYIDGKEVFSRVNDRFHRPLHLVFDCEIMYSWVGEPDRSKLPQVFSVDWVRIR